jgi:ABC-type sugar transport system ATPase subunit
MPAMNMTKQDTPAAAGTDETIVLKMTGISKSFPGVQALKDITFTLRKGEIHIILGENGAGKSTLMKILAGVYTKDEGSIVLHGKEVVFAGVLDAAGHGIGFIPQELDLIPTLSVAQNIYLGREDRFCRFGCISNKAMAYASVVAMRRVGISIDPKALVRTLSMSAATRRCMISALR